MKLSQLQKKIMPLPWTPHTIMGDGSYEQLKANAVYCRHCANNLPALVEAVRKYKVAQSAYQKRESNGELCDAMSFAEHQMFCVLEKAEEVKDL